VKDAIAVVPGHRQIDSIILPPIPWTPDRISFVSGTAPDPFELYERLGEKGIRVELLDPGPKPLNPFFGKGSLLQSFDPMRALRVLVGKRSADLVISVFEGGAVVLLLLRRLLGFKGRVILWDIALTENWRLRERVLNYVVPRVDGILVLGNNQKRYIEKRWAPKNPIFVVFHYVDATFYKPGISRHDGAILSVGDDVGRDFACLIGAIEGMSLNAVLKTRMQISINPEYGQNIKVIRARLSPEQFRDLYEQCRFVVVPLNDTLNASGVSTILEAGAMGKAVIVSDSAGIRDYVVPDETCLMVPCGDVIALRRAIQRLLDEPETCARLGANARRLVETRFSIPVFADAFAETLGKIGRPQN
jgi:glycosyltransferase involved in cell wall biosynthesis